MGSRKGMMTSNRSRSSVWEASGKVSKATVVTENLKHSHNSELPQRMMPCAGAPGSSSSLEGFVKAIAGDTVPIVWDPVTEVLDAKWHCIYRMMKETENEGNGTLGRWMACGGGRNRRWNSCWEDNGGILGFTREEKDVGEQTEWQPAALMSQTWITSLTGVV